MTNISKAIYLIAFISMICCLINYANGLPIIRDVDKFEPMCCPKHNQYDNEQKPIFNMLNFLLHNKDI